MLLLATSCEADPKPDTQASLFALVGAQSACAGAVSGVTVALLGPGGTERLLARRAVNDPSDLPFQVAIDLAPDSGSYTLVATFTTASPEAQSRQQIVVQSGASGRVSLTLPCGCIGRQCAGNENCREEKAGSGKTVCEAAETCGDGTCNGSEDTLSCQNDCPSVCGDGSCQGDEGCEGCPQDCGACSAPQCGDKLCSSGESCATCAADCGDGCYSVKVVRSVGPLGHWASINEPPPGYTVEGTFRIRPDGAGNTWYLCDINGRQTVSLDPGCESGTVLEKLGVADADGKNGAVEIFRCRILNSAAGNVDHFLSQSETCEQSPQNDSKLDGPLGFARVGP